MFGAGGVGGIILGILFILLALATWVITLFGEREWYSISTAGQLIAGTGSVIGVVVIYITFGVFFLIIWVISLFA
jgi:hypothetical protein